MSAALPMRALGRTGLQVPALGYGTVKLGRDRSLKYPSPFEVPDDETAARILHRVLDLGLTLIDTAPAYGLAEERIGRHLAKRRGEFVMVTKVGERFDPLTGRSEFDFSPSAIERSIEESVHRLAGPVDVLLVHADEADVALAGNLAIVAALERARARGLTRSIGFSGKTRPREGSPGNEAALAWAEVLMVEVHLEERSVESLLERCADRGVGVLAKKVLGSGRFDPEAALRFVLGNPCVDCAVVGGLNLDHIAANADLAGQVRGQRGE